MGTQSALCLVAFCCLASCGHNLAPINDGGTGSSGDGGTTQIGPCPARQAQTLTLSDWTQIAESDQIRFGPHILTASSGAQSGLFFRLGPDNATTLANLAATINSTPNAKVTAFSTATSITVEALDPGAPPMVASVNYGMPAALWTPTLPAEVDVLSGNLVRSGGVVSVWTLPRRHNLALGQTVQIYSTTPEANFPIGPKIVTALLPVNASGISPGFTYSEAGPNVESTINYEMWAGTIGGRPFDSTTTRCLP